MFMRRLFSRITLEITERRVQRLRAISDDDAKAEGVRPYTPPHGALSPEQRVPGPGFDGARIGDQPHRLPFADRWDSINGKRRRRVHTELGERGYPGMISVIEESFSWESNPFVWALTFRVVP